MKQDVCGGDGGAPQHDAVPVHPQDSHPRPLSSSPTITNLHRANHVHSGVSNQPYPQRLRRLSTVDLMNPLQPQLLEAGGLSRSDNFDGGQQQSAHRCFCSHPGVCAS
jgi:hypothetical protein